jgi:hypothetical protein
MVGRAGGLVRNSSTTAHGAGTDRKIGDSRWQFLGDFTNITETMTCPEVGHEVVL